MKLLIGNELINDSYGGSKDTVLGLYLDDQQMLNKALEFKKLNKTMVSFAVYRMEFGKTPVRIEFNKQKQKWIEDKS